MCKAEYNAVWEKGIGERCPNLIPTAHEREIMNLGNVTTFPVDVIVRTQYRDHYESLASLWSDWNRLWLEYSRPRLVSTVACIDNGYPDSPHERLTLRFMY